MFKALKKIFKTKLTESKKLMQSLEIDKNHCILLDNLIDEKDKQSEVKILRVFSENLTLFHRIVFPVFNLAKEFGLGVIDFSDLIKKGFNLVSFDKLLNYIKKIEYSYKQTVYSTFSKRYGIENAHKFSEDLFNKCRIPFFNFSYVPEEWFEEIQESFRRVFLNNKFQYEAEDLLREQIKIYFIKYFSYEDYINEIDKIPELTKILINASYKYQNIETISKETHDIFIDYMKLDKNIFPLNIYNEFISVYFASKNICNDFYEEVLLNFDYKNMNMSEVVSLIIETKVYQNFDIYRLILSILYQKISTFDCISEFFEELNNITTFVSEIRKEKTKYDLLNNNYNIRTTTIVDIDLMNGIEFENFLCKLLGELDFICETTKVSGDQGVDIIAYKDNNKIAIQAKCYNRPVGNHAVMEVIAGSKYYGANQCMVITNNTFTKAAKDLAAANGVILWDRKTLVEKMVK